MVKILAISDVHGEENENLYTYLTNNDIDLVLILGDYYSGTRRDGETLRTAGGRVLSVTAVAPTAGEARSRAYAGVGLIHFEGARFRHDIGTAGGLSHDA